MILLDRNAHVLTRSSAIYNPTHIQARVSQRKVGILPRLVIVACRRLTQIIHGTAIAPSEHYIRSGASFILSHLFQSHHHECNGDPAQGTRRTKPHQSTFANALTELKWLTVFELPGFGLPYNDWGHDTHREMASLLSAVAGWNHDLMTVRERCMLFFVNAITDKPEWYRKVHDKNVVAKWEHEAKGLDWSKVGLEHGDMSTKMFDYVSTLDRRHLP
jgi:hypothetical protein